MSGVFVLITAGIAGAVEIEGLDEVVKTHIRCDEFPVCDSCRRRRSRFAVVSGSGRPKRSGG